MISQPHFQTFLSGSSTMSRGMEVNKVNVLVDIIHYGVPKLFISRLRSLREIVIGINPENWKE